MSDRKSSKWWGVELNGGGRVIVCAENKPPEDETIAFKVAEGVTPVSLAANSFRVITEAMPIHDALLWVDKLTKV